MKKICRKLKLMKYGCVFDQETLDKLSGESFVVCFSDGTYECYCSKSDLVRVLENDQLNWVSGSDVEKLGELKINSHLLNDLIERFKNGFILDGTRYIEEE